jgi:type 1 glutamine amidotransferase
MRLFFFFIPHLLLLAAVIQLSAQDTIIHYTETTGFDHNTRAQSLALFQDIGDGAGFVVLSDNDGELFNKEDLNKARAVIFSNTSGSNGLNASQKAALEWFVDTLGRHLLGIHAASDTYRHSSANGGNTGQWDWYAETLGGSVQTSPNHTSQNHVDTIFRIEDHPSISEITFPWIKEEEYYYWESGYLNDNNISLLEVGQTGDQSYDRQRPVAWYREKPSGAKIFYTSLGHKRGNFTGDFPDFEQLIQDAMIWLLECPDARATIEVSICEGEEYIFNGRSLTESGLYADTLKLNSGCDSIVELQLTVDALNTRVELEDNLLAVPDSAANYQWLDCEESFEVIPGATEPTFQANESGSYAVEVISAEGCIDTSECKEVILSSLESRPLQQAVVVFPNPVHDHLNLNFEQVEGEVRIEIFNSQGHSQLIQTGTFSSGEAIDVATLSPGMYFLLLQVNEFSFRSKFMKL